MKMIGMMTGIVLWASTIVHAAGVVPAHISADAKWFGHLNIEGIHGIPEVQKLREKFLSKDHVKEKVAEATEKLGMNPTEDILGITVYSTIYEGKNGVVLIHVRKADQKKLLALFENKHPDHKTSMHGDRTLYHWTAKHHHHEQDLTGTFASDTIIVIGADSAMVQQALDVLDGKSQGLTADSPLVAGMTDHDLLIGRAVDIPEELGASKKCEALKNISGGFAHWTYQDGKLSGNYEIAIRSTDIANNYKAIIDGVKAVGSLRYQDLDSVLKVINSLSADVNDNTLTISFNTSIDDIKAGVKQAKEHHKEHGHGRHRRGKRD